MFGFGMKDIKLFVIICVGLVALLLFMVPPNTWWFLWDYMETTPIWLQIGQAWPLWLLAFFITIFAILVRELVFR